MSGRAFQWTVLIFNSTTSVQILKHLNRSYETTRRPENCTDVTLHDEYTGILDSIDALKKRLKKEPTFIAVANKYDGAELSNRLV